MKTFLAILLLLGFGFGGAFYAGKEAKKREIAGTKPSLAPVSAFQPTLYPLQNRSFVVIVIGCNNGASVEKTLQSIFSQNYENYRVIYIDDASDDGSFELSRERMYDSNQMMRVTLAKNEHRLGMLANLFRAVQSCQDTEIAVVLGGEDWLAHEWVLARLNQYYANSELWMTYGQYREYPQYSLGFSKPMAAGNLRQEPFSASHLKSFYAGLFKKIPRHELMEEGQFFSAASELAFMLPLLEMAEGHSAFVPEVLYIVSRITKEDREIAARCEKAIRAKPAHAALAKLTPNSEIAAP